MNQKNDIWANLDAQIEAREQHKKIRAQECEERTAALMETFAIFQSAVADYVPIAKRYGVKCYELEFYKRTFFRKRLRIITVPAYYLIYCGRMNTDGSCSMYLSEDGQLLLGESDDDGPFRIRKIDFTPAYALALKNKINEYISSKDISMYRSTGSNYIYHDIVESLVRLTYHFSDDSEVNKSFGYVPHIIHWDKRRSEKEIRELIQEFFVARIRKELME